MARQQRIGNPRFELTHFTETFISENWIVRLYKLNKPKNRPAFMIGEGVSAAAWTERARLPSKERTAHHSRKHPHIRFLYRISVSHDIDLIAHGTLLRCSIFHSAMRFTTPKSRVFIRSVSESVRSSGAMSNPHQHVSPLLRFISRSFSPQIILSLILFTWSLYSKRIQNKQR